MSIDKKIKKFLIDESFSQASKPVYENVLMVFAGYLSENNCNIGELEIKDIFRSLDYYIDVRKIKYENTARFFISAIKEFLIYCNHKEDIKLDRLMHLFGYGDNEGGFEDKVDIKINSLIKKKIVKKEKTGSEISADELEKLIIRCNNIVDNFVVQDLETNIYNGKYKEYISALGLKIIAYTGIKVGLLHQLRVEDILESEKKLRIRNLKKNRDFEIEIPKILCEQLANYRNCIRYELIKVKNINNDSGYLFINFDGVPIMEKGKNTPYNELLYETIGKNKKMGSSTARLSKRAIIDMISSNMSIKMIEDFTGNGNVIIGYCKEKVDEIKKEQKEPNKYIEQYLKKRDDENPYYNNF